MSTMSAASRIVKTLRAPAVADQARTAAAKAAHESALHALDRAIRACRRLARTGDSAAAREAEFLARALHVVSDPLFQCLTPVCESGRWVR